MDGRHAYEDAVGDYAEWLSGVRDGGVILFHDVAERTNGFGVWRLWEEIAEPGRSFTFQHGHGLGVLAVGTVEKAPLRALFDADEETADRGRSDFSRLGGIVDHQAWLRRELERVTGELRSRAARARPS